MILDTNAISDLFKMDAAVMEAIGDDSHQVPVIVVGEYVYGLEGSSRKEDLTRHLRTLLDRSDVLNITTSTAVVYGQVKQKLRIQGTPLPANDIWIAALAIEHNLPILTRDAHFDRVPGLRRQSW